MGLLYHNKRQKSIDSGPLRKEKDEKYKPKEELIAFAESILKMYKK
jgi:hypothetical protein